VKIAHNDELGSSPPRFEKDNKLDAGQPNSDVRIKSSFEYGQPETPFNVLFDEGTTIDEETVLAPMAADIEVEDRSDNDPTSDVIMSEVPSPAIDLQLTAQLDADIQAHTSAKTDDTNKPLHESNNVFVDAASHPQSSLVDDEQVGNKTEVDESQPASPDVTKTSRVRMTSTPRANSSFNKSNSEKGTPQSQSLRRSFRHSNTNSPSLSLGNKKRKSTPAKAEKAKEVTMEDTEDVQEEQTPTKAPVKQSSPQPDENGILDNIIVASPAHRQTSSKKRKSMSSAGPTQVVVPETRRKRGPVRRSQSLLSQVENSQDILAEDTPAPKRPRQSASQDVSDAKNASQAKRLSHVQVTHKRSSDGAPLEQPTPAPEQPKSVPMGTSTPSRSFTERVILTPRSIINQLKSLKDYLFSAPQLVLGRDEERELDDALFEIRRVVHAAGVRGEDNKE
jgi:hypothetical protein